MQTKAACNHTCMVHKTAHHLSCYMNIPKYSKLFIQIVRETSVRETSCTGNNRRVRAHRHLGNVFPGNVLSGNRVVRETSVRESDCPGNIRYPLESAKLQVCQEHIISVGDLKEKV